MYYGEPRSPNPLENHALEMATHLAGIAIERRLTHERLQRSEAYLAEAQRLSHTGSWAFNLGRLSTGRKKISEMWDQSAGGSSGPRHRCCKRIHQRIAIRCSNTSRRHYARKGTTNVRIQNRAARWNSQNTFHGLGHPVFSASGELVEVVGTQLDVTGTQTRRRRARTIASGSGGSCTHKSSEHDGELDRSLAHEIKQPISAAITNAQTCLRWLRRDEPDLPEAREAASRIV